jgi:signal transduction histidine kinase
LRERVRAVEHLSMLGEVAAGIAHEIANPLASVNSNIVALAEYMAELAPVIDTARGDLADVAADVPVLLRDIQEGISRVEEIIRNMKSMVRIQREDQPSETLSVLEVTNSVARLVRPRLRSKLVIDVPATTLVLGRTVDLTQVLMNLIINADDACEERVRTDAARSGVAPMVQVSTGSVGDEVHIDVTDNGTGISEENIIKVFQPLFSTKGGKGTGLGLSICQRLTEALSGRLEVQSKVGSGTTFRLWLRRGAVSS